MKRILTAAALASMGLLTACSSMGHVDYECALTEVQAAKCASMEDAYKLSSKVKSDGSHKQSVFEGQPTPGKGGTAVRAETDNKPFFRGESSHYPDAAQQGAPVFKQPKVMRVWVAPYVDADGNLRSGEYTYFATPGSWNYGSLNKPGAASGIFEPTKPGQLGFNPTSAATGQKVSPTLPAAAGAPARPPETGAKSDVKQAAPAAPASQSGITQPYQRLSN